MQFVKTISSSSLSDSELILLYKQSNKLEALGELYQRYMDLVYGVCLNYLKDPENAKDSVLNIFEELITKLIRHEVENFKPWLYQLAKNHCLMQLRSEKKFIKTEIDPSLMQNEEMLHLNDALEKEAHLQQLTHCLEQLNSDQKRAVELFYLEGKCYKEIAAVTGIDWNKIRSYIQNGRRNLKICLEKQKIQSALNA